MKPRVTIVFAIIFLLLGGYYYFYMVKAEKPKGKGEIVFPEFNPSLVEEINLSNYFGKFHLKRTQDGWMLLYPEKVKAGSERIDSILDSLRLMAEIKRVSDNPSAQNLEAFGLEKPAITLEMKIKGRDNPLILYLGNLNPTYGKVYGMANLSKKVFLADIEYRWDLNMEKEKITGEY